MSLDDTQKHQFITLGRMLVPERGRFAEGDQAKRGVAVAGRLCAATHGAIGAYAVVDVSVAPHQSHVAL